MPGLAFSKQQFGNAAVPGFGCRCSGDQAAAITRVSNAYTQARRPEQEVVFINQRTPTALRKPLQWQFQPKTTFVENIFQNVNNILLLKICYSV